METHVHSRNPEAIQDPGKADRPAESQYKWNLSAFIQALSSSSRPAVLKLFGLQTPFATKMIEDPKELCRFL